MVNIPGDWDLVQSNNAKVHVHCRQFGDEFVGSGRNLGPNIAGDLSGSTQGRFLTFTIDWHDGTFGVYNGFVNFNGVVTGTSFDQNHPESQALWHSLQNF